MTERTRNGKTLAQDATAIVFCLVGGFFAVSVVRLLQGHEAKESFAALTRPVVALAAALGAPAALVLGLGLAALGGLLFVRSRALSPLRPLSALVLGALGLALVLGAFEAGGALGGWLPGLVGGLIGRVVGVILGAALTWLGWMVGFPPSAPRESTAEALQRIGLATRQDAAGVSPAEAALLGSDARSAGGAVAAPGPKPAAAPRREEPLRTETLVPRAPATPARAEPRPEEPAAPLEAASSALTPPTPSWEALEAEETVDAAAELAAEESEAPEQPDEPDEPAQDLSVLRASRAEVFSAREEAPGAAELEEEAPEELAEEDEGEEYEIPAHVRAEEDPEAEEDADELEEELAALDGAEEEVEEQAEPELQTSEPPLPRAAWEQVGLFDGLDEPTPAADERTPSFDFDAPAPPARAAPAPAAAARAADDPFAAPPAPKADFTLTPATPRPAPSGARDDAEERWQALVYEAGCLILEQKRVAVSMLERRFAIDFDAACKVLDELQQAGLIGPYIGGRSRDILLGREEWLSHAPHAS